MLTIKNFGRRSLALFLAVITFLCFLTFFNATGNEALSGVVISANAADASVLRTKSDAQNRLNTLISKLNGKYFTTTEKAVYSSKCDSCYNVNVIASSWLKKTVGMVPNSYSLMPEHYYSASNVVTNNAWSCAGFANYALWYIYANSSSDNVKRVNVYTGKFTKSDLDKANLWPGDVIRIDNWHSMLYISHDSSGLKVLDSNFDSDNKIQVHTISYSWHKNTTMACTRGKNYTTKSASSQNTTTYWTTNFKMKSGAYTNAYSAVNGSKVGRVYPNDVVTVKTVYSSGWMKISCPWTNNTTKTVYVKISEFKFKATKYINAYSGINGSKVGRVYPNDIVTVQAIYQSGWMKCQCPWTGNTTKTVYVKVSEIY